MNKDIDEADVYRLMAKIKKANCLGIVQNLNKRIVEYLLKEWDQKPTNDELVQVIAQFYGMKDENLDKLFEAVTHEEYTMLAAMTYGLLSED